MDKHLTKACAGIALAALAGQFLLGCDSAGSSRSSVPFPVAIGDTWTYTVENAGQPLPSVLVKKITGITPVPGGQRVSMAITSVVYGIPKTIHQDYLFGTDGSISFPNGPITSTVTPANAGNVTVPPLSVVNSGRPVTWTVKMPPLKLAGRKFFSGNVRITVRGGGTASVTVPAGTYRVTVVNTTVQATTSGFPKPLVVVQRMWFAPHVGEVGEELIRSGSGSGQVVETEKLQSFTAG